MIRDGASHCRRSRISDNVVSHKLLPPIIAVYETFVRISTGSEAGGDRTMIGGSFREFFVCVWGGGGRECNFLPSTNPSSQPQGGGGLAAAN